MFKSLSWWIIFVLAFLFAIGTSAKESESRFMSVIVPCESDLNYVLNIAQEQYNEKPFATGKILVQEYTTGRWHEVEVLMFAHVSGSSWSIISTYPNGMGCIQTMGRDFKVISQDYKKTE